MLLIFDLDGTLIDTNGAVRDIVRDLFRAEGFDLTDEMMERCDPFQSFGVPDKFHAMADACGLSLSVGQAEAMAVEHEARKVKIYGSGGVVVFPGVPEALRRLGSDGHALCVGSSNPSQNALLVLEATGIRQFFTHGVFGSDHAGGRMKPDPGIFVHALRSNGYLPGASGVLVIEDSMAGLQAARALDLPVLVHAPSGDFAPWLAAGAKHAFSDYAQLAEIVGPTETDRREA